MSFFVPTGAPAGTNFFLDTFSAPGGPRPSRVFGLFLESSCLELFLPKFPNLGSFCLPNTERAPILIGAASELFVSMLESFSRSKSQPAPLLFGPPPNFSLQDFPSLSRSRRDVKPIFRNFPGCGPEYPGLCRQPLTPGRSCIHDSKTCPTDSTLSAPPCEIAVLCPEKAVSPDSKEQSQPGSHSLAASPQQPPILPSCRPASLLGALPGMALPC